MDWLNYHHLLYFWTVVKEGTVSQAAEVLHISQPTVSAQLRCLEKSLGQRLFQRRGRTLALTVEGEAVFRYAEEIFSLGQELLQTIRGETRTSTKRFCIGISDALPKLTTYRLIEPAFAMQPAFRLYVRIDKTDRLLAELAVHAIDLVIADSPMMTSNNIRAFSHLLGETSVSIFGTSSLARSVRKNFPNSLDGSPMLLQTPNTSVRQSLDQWFDVQRIHPQIIGEVEDTIEALRELGSEGLWGTGTDQVLVYLSMWDGFAYRWLWSESARRIQPQGLDPNHRIHQLARVNKPEIMWQDKDWFKFLRRCKEPLAKAFYELIGEPMDKT